MNKVNSLLNSRRFYAAIGGLAAVVMSERLGISQDDAGNIVMLVGAWILGDSLSKTQ